MEQQNILLWIILFVILGVILYFIIKNNKPTQINIIEKKEEIIERPPIIVPPYNYPRRPHHFDIPHPPYLQNKK